MRHALDKEMNFAIGPVVGKAVVRIRYVLDEHGLGDLALLGVGVVTEGGLVPAPWLEANVLADASLLTEMRQFALSGSRSKVAA